MLEVQCALYVIDRIVKGGKRFDNERDLEILYLKKCVHLELISW